MAQAEEFWVCGKVPADIRRWLNLPTRDYGYDGAYRTKLDELVPQLERGLTRGEHQNQKIYGDQYETRFEHVLRTDAEDVTSQIIKAYKQAV